MLKVAFVQKELFVELPIRKNVSHWNVSVYHQKWLQRKIHTQIYLKVAPAAVMHQSAKMDPLPWLLKTKTTVVVQSTSVQVIATYDFVKSGLRVCKFLEKHMTKLLVKRKPGDVINRYTQLLRTICHNNRTYW